MPHVESKPGWLSVTETLNLAINKPFLAKWRGKIGNELADQIQRESQELGIAVHAEIEERFKGKGWLQPYSNDNIGRMVRNFSKWVVENDIKPLQLEVSLEDEKLKLQGTFDAKISCIKGDYIADWKTSNSLDKIGVPLQLAAYCHLSQSGIWKGLAVRIDKEKDKVEVKEYDNLAPYWPLFQDCLRVARYIKWGLEE